MTRSLSEWADREGPGAKTRLQAGTGLAYTTVLRACDGGPIGLRASLLLSRATGWKVLPGDISDEAEVLEDYASFICSRRRKRRRTA